MPPALPLDAYVVRVVVPVAGVVASVVLLGLAAFVLVSGIGSERLRLGLFTAGVLCWFVGIAWGVVANRKPPPPRLPEW